LDTFTVSLAPGEPAALLTTENEPAAAREWTLKEVPLKDGYVAAVAVEGRGCRFSYWLWHA
jgi:4'-phosphopantetheinyl transferase